MEKRLKIFEIAKQLRTNSKRISDMLNEIGIYPKGYMSMLEPEELQRFYASIGYNPEKSNDAAENTQPSGDIQGANDKQDNTRNQQRGNRQPGVIVRRVVVDTPQVAPMTPQAPTKPTGPTAKKQMRNQSHTASSGLRSGLEVRSDNIDDIITDMPKREMQEKQIKNDAPSQTEKNTDEPRVRRIKRIAKVDIPEEKKEAVPEKAQESVESIAVSEVIVVDTEKKTAVPETVETKPVQEEIKETIPQAEEKTEEAKTEEKIEEEAQDVGSMYIPKENIDIDTHSLEEVKKPEEKAKEIKEEKPEVVEQHAVVEKPRQRNDIPEKPREQTDRKNNKFDTKADIPAIPVEVPAPETRREHAPKSEKEFVKPSKREGKKDVAKPAQVPAKNKYKAERQYVGEKKGVSEIYSDDYHTSFDMEKNNAKKNMRQKKDKPQKSINEVLHTAQFAPAPTNVIVPESLSVKEFAELIKKTSADVIKKLISMGVMANQNQIIDFDTATLLASEYGITVQKEVIVTDEDILFDDSEENDEGAVERPPVVVVMGHVDHGKTSLLDAIRSSKVTGDEAGGITQHIGAYTVKINDRKITFLDTPGHEAFTAMRARGASVTDVAILVVAADDGVMPQTIEAINHAKAAKLSIVVAVNKMDKEGANFDRVKQELAEHDVVSEEWGGDVPFVPVSAKTRTNIDLLLETVLLSADILDLKADPDKQAKGSIIEAKLDKNKGPVATLLVQRGTLKPGDAIVSGITFGRIRTMTDDRGHMLKKAGPSTPVEITGLPEVPEAGELFYAVKDERTAKHLIETRRADARSKQMQSGAKVSLEDLYTQIQEGMVKDLNVIIKADVVGSVEAVKQALEKLTNDKVRIKVIHGAVGAITESDVSLAEVSNAIIIGFNVRPGANIAEHAEASGVDMRLYRVIYDAINDIKAAMEGLLDPEFKENVIGHADIRQIFHVGGIGTIAGAYVTNGKIIRNSEARIVRNGIVIYEGKLASLKRFKDDVKEVNSGYECGLSLERYDDIKEGDVLECFVMEEVKKDGQNNKNS